MSEIEDAVRQYVPLPSAPTQKGWYPVLCKVCNDHGKKGPRGGFRFQTDSLEYNCFNCGHKAFYDPFKHNTIPKKTLTVFESFGIPCDSIDSIRIKAFKTEKDSTGNNTPNDDGPSPIQTIKLPDFFTPLSQDTTIWGELAINYLESERGVSPDAYPFYVCSSNENKLQRLWYGRLIIPLYNNQGQIISYQGRALVPQLTPKYRTYTKSELTIYGYEQVYSYTESPLFITEGFFDAFCINGISVLGNEINQTQINIINQSNRRKIYIPDQYGDGWRAGYDALNAGWEISFPEFGSCKDVNEAYLKYGKLYTINTIMENTCSGMSAKIRLEMLKQKDSKRKSTHRRNAV